ncbi:MAG: hypothetical protein QE485_01245 [Acidovorax sp.]|uniref:hypothetical protein n=1 Tax=Acidovorax sp. TaxID=1872122 RepID=UPI00263804C7|nr:hypothetical protein [Acidovorax sp.]MDH4415832.1 hypothetical protein [Acidovorax sp.]
MNRSDWHLVAAAGVSLLENPCEIVKKAWASICRSRSILLLDALKHRETQRGALLNRTFLGGCLTGKQVAKQKTLSESIT